MAIESLTAHPMSVISLAMSHPIPAHRVRLFHGLRADPDEVEAVMTDIRANGIGKPEGSRRYPHRWLDAAEIERLSALDEIDRDDTRPADAPLVDWLFACADPEGAMVYAARPSRDGEMTAIMVEIEIDRDALVVDGNDTLYNLAVHSDRTEIRAAIGAIYGPACLAHLDRAASGNTLATFARADLACSDPAVVRHHLDNRAVVVGRHGTCFQSSVMFPLGMGNPSIIRIWVPDTLSRHPKADHDILALVTGARRGG